jgi:hypothetical protein
MDNIFKYETINTYDVENDVYERGIFIHFGDVRIKVARDLNEFNNFIENLKAMKKEIAENHLVRGDTPVNFGEKRINHDR